ncbi:Guanyl-specific ribonuclease Sa [Actinokineospora spheciospongiae]|uniref:Guanyl-specific ribonuclease Sa n=1 Tax=Actinokineospora spheciospongiae TaxID=909613 RepID=W7IIV3_9PSEU|nr:ribonuclease domain-containing protein [Actinokineospora spheciospongiae]EWC60133.1 Guanyl-specific ribonuclease Sa [Actinokineospora spheciospongiae]
MGSRKRITGALVGLVLIVLLGWLTQVANDSDSTSAPPTGSTTTGVHNGSGSGSDSGSGSAGVPSKGRAVEGMVVRALSELPPQAGQTWALIEKGGPFPYPRNDGVTFQNREGRLPKQASGYYKEYTVPTPGSPDRGARRLITGSGSEVFYTEDHYDSFVSVDTGR